MMHSFARHLPFFAIAVFLALLFFLVPFYLPAQENSHDPYDPANPFQRFPEGVKESVYFRRKATPQPVEKYRIDPPNWWIGMQSPKLQILIHDQGVGTYDLSVNYPGVRVEGVHRVENTNYLFVDLFIGPGAKPGKMEILLTKGDARKTYPYELKARDESPGRVRGLDASDLIYLIMPDRFANGYTGNDRVEGMQQTGINRDKVAFRHGGDLLGVMEHLGYLENLGITAVWLNPVFENDQPYESYHGYAITDHYRIDPRFGGNEQYLQFVKLCHERGIKVVMDIIMNHVGDFHWFIRDLPSADWITQFDTFTKAVFRGIALADPYASKLDRDLVTTGWFDSHMPDLNLKNPFVANYLIQNHIWWVEYSGQDAYRIDTYPYADQAFMSEWGRRMQEEFPGLGIFGETYVNGLGTQAQFAQNRHLVKDFNSHLPGVADFQMHYALTDALTVPFGWTEGVTRLYYTLGQDFLYEDPFRNVIFLDNHDRPRWYPVVGEDMKKFKSGIALLLTTRGIPCLYYGTEILLGGTEGMFGEAGRRDFVGGWANDPVNKFQAKGRTSLENEAFDYIQKLSVYRKATPALHRGKLTQFVPENGVYVYFRSDQDKTIMVVYNSNDRPVNVSTRRFAERMFGFTGAKEVVSGKNWNDISTITVERNSTLVLELQ